MDFLAIRKRARERAEARAAAAPAGEPSAPAPASGAAEEGSPPGAEPPAPPIATVPPPDAPPPAAERRRRGDEPVLTEADLAEGALQARFQGLAPAGDGRFATWRPGAGPPPIEPDHGAFVPRVEAPEPPAASAGPPAGRGEAVPEDRAPVVVYTPPAPAASAAPAALARRVETDALEAFFYRPDEEAPDLPLLSEGGEEAAISRAPDLVEEFLTFVVGREEYAVAIEHVREVIRAPTITEVPRAPRHVLGIVSVRGEIVPVLDARGRLGLAADEGATGRLLLLDAGEGPMALLVDAVLNVVRLPSGAIEPCPHGIAAAAADCVTGVGRWRDRIFLVLDVAGLLHGHAPGEER